MIQNKSLVYKQVPQGLPEMGKHLAVESSEFDLDSKLNEGSILVRVQWTSLDPYMRGRLRQPGSKSYAPAFDLDKPLTSRSICKVLKSANENFKEGQTIATMCNMSDYTVVPKEMLAQATVITNPHNIDIAHYLGALGMPGLTAYASFYDIGQPKKGETIFVTAASGAVGQLVCQLAKHEGLKVIASVGDDKKVEYMQKELGVEDTFNYKKESTADALKRLAPNGIDIYYDNVGGEVLDAALDATNVFARIVGCGAISQYNLKPEDRYGVKNLVPHLFAKQLTIRGFIISSIGPKYSKEHQEKVGAWLADGSFKALLHVDEGMDNSGKALLGLFSGANFGKAILKVE